MTKEQRNLTSTFISLASLGAFLNGFYLVGAGLILGSAALVTKSLVEE